MTHDEQYAEALTATRISEIKQADAERRGLKDCPFCGGGATFESFLDGFRRVYRIECAICGVIKDADDDARAVYAWNKRVTDKKEE